MDCNARMRNAQYLDRGMSPVALPTGLYVVNWCASGKPSGAQRLGSATSIGPLPPLFPTPSP